MLGLFPKVGMHFTHLAPGVNRPRVRTPIGVVTL